MEKIKNSYFFIGLLALSFLNLNLLNAEEVRTVPTGSPTCLVNDACAYIEIREAQEVASRNALNAYNEIAQLASAAQTQECTQAVNNYINNICPRSRHEELRAELARIQNLIDEKLNASQQTQAEVTNITDLSTSESLRQLLDLILTIEAEINALRDSADPPSLTLVRAELEHFNEICTDNHTMLMITNTCTPPRAESRDNGTVIVRQKITENSSTIEVTEVPPGTGSTYSVEAQAVAVANGELGVQEIASERSRYSSTYNNSLMESGASFTQLRATEDSATRTISDIRGVAESLQSAINAINTVGGENDGIETGICDAVSIAAGNCGSAREDIPRPQAPPPGLGVAENPPAGAPAPGGGSPGVSGADLIAGVNEGPAYGGGATSPGGGADAAGRGGNAPGAGGLMNSLSGLGSMFGKTGGGFGSEGYRDSSNGRFASGGLSNQNRSGPGFALPGQNVDFTPNSRSADTGLPQGQPRAFNAGLGNNGQGNSFGGAAGGALGGGNAGSGGSGSNASGQKPGLLSRLLGKKRDKTMFGKTESSGRGGSFKNAGKASPSVGLNGAYEDASNVALDANGQRIFDASKYAPSQAAQDRAYARATGRRIASTVQRPNSGSMDWPSDISKDRNGNMFMKVRLSHTSFINNSSARP